MSIQTFSKIGEDNYVVVFRSLLSENSKGYPQMAERMKKLVSQQEGFLEFSSAREGVIELLCLATEKKMQKNYNLSNKVDLSKAIQLLEQNTKKSLTYHLKIEKFIPMGAGLGGGSSNAAAILFAFNQIFSLGFSLEKLARLGEKLGARCAFFFTPKTTSYGRYWHKSDSRH